VYFPQRQAEGLLVGDQSFLLRFHHPIERGSWNEQDRYTSSKRGRGRRLLYMRHAKKPPIAIRTTVHKNDAPAFHK
jgi:hypothetical protein